MTRHISNKILISLIWAAICLSSTRLIADPVVTQFTTSYNSRFIYTATDNSNNAVAILVDQSRIYATTSLGGGLWTPLQNLAPTAGNYSNPSVAMDASGTAIAMWGYSDTPQVQTAYYSGGVWNTPTPQPLDSADPSATSVAMNGSGQGLGAWTTNNDVKVSFFSAGTWSSVVTIFTDDEAFSNSIVASYSPSGRASVVCNRTPDFSTFSLSASTYNGSVWTGEVNLDADLTGNPDAGIDAAGNTIAIWSSGTGVDDIVSSRFDGVSWSSPATLSTGTGNGNNPRIAVDSDGTAIAVWVDSAGDLNMIQFDGSTWGTPVVIASNLANPQFTQPDVAMNADGDAIIGWVSSNQLFNVLLPKSWVLKPPVLIATGIGNLFLDINLAFSSTYGFNVWAELFVEDFNTFGASNLFFEYPSSTDCYNTKSATGEVLVVESSMIAEMKFAYNINRYNAPTSGLGTVTFDFGLAILESLGTGSAKIFNRVYAYAPSGQGVSVVFAASFFNGDEGTSAIAGIGNEVDGFFFGSIDGIFGIIHRNNSVDTFTPQTSWNVDKMDGTGPSGMVLDFTLGNVYKIQYQRLEFGNINFYIEPPNTGQFVLVNQIQYTNNNTVPSVTNPGMQLMGNIQSDGGEIYLEISSMALYIEGLPDYKLGVRNSVSANNSFNSTNSSLLIIRNEPFLAVDNKQMVFPDELSLMVTSNSTYDAVFSLYVNVDGGGFPSFTPIPNSCVSYSTDSFTIFSGTLLGTFVLAPGSEASINISDYQILIPPGTDNDLYLACYVLGPGTASVSGSLSWLEQF